MCARGHSRGLVWLKNSTHHLQPQWRAHDWDHGEPAPCVFTAGEEKTDRPMAYVSKIPWELTKTSNGERRDNQRELHNCNGEPAYALSWLENEQASLGVRQMSVKRPLRVGEVIVHWRPLNTLGAQENSIAEDKAESDKSRGPIGRKNSKREESHPGILVKQARA